MKYKLLIIDEVSSYLLLVEKILVNEGFEVYVTEKEEKVYNYLMHNSPDIILIDVLMKNKKGFHILEKLKTEYNFSKPLIVISAGKKISTIKKAFSHGAYDYLIKPLNFKDLINKVSKALDTSLQNKNKCHV